MVFLFFFVYVPFKYGFVSRWRQNKWCKCWTGWQAFLPTPNTDILTEIRCFFRPVSSLTRWLIKRGLAKIVFKQGSVHRSNGDVLVKKLFTLTNGSDLRGRVYTNIPVMRSCHFRRHKVSIVTKHSYQMSLLHYIFLYYYYWNMVN